MANLDTAAKRLSGINVSCPWRGLFPIPDGDISSAGDRQTAAYFYSGINPAVAPNAGSGTVSGTGTLVGDGYRVSEGSGTVNGTGVLNGTNPVSTARTQAGVRRARFLRRAPKLPWEEDLEETKDEQVSIAPPKRKRIPLPVVQAIQRTIDPIPIQAVKEIVAPAITIPAIGTAVLQEIEDDDDLLWLI